jgi:hypothetical protein
MYKLIHTAAVSCIAAGLLLSPAVFAGSQQDKMTACNKEAKEKNLAGDERKAFMKECLSANKADAAGAKAEESSAKSAQQEKMKACNKQAGEKALKGEERKTFMSECLKG